MKLQISLLLILMALPCCHAHHCGEGATPTRKPGWFNGRRRSESDESHTKDMSILKTSAMHSFTGIEGFDHNTESPNDDMAVPDKMKKRQVQNVKADDEDIHDGTKDPIVFFSYFQLFFTFQS